MKNVKTILLVILLVILGSYTIFVFFQAYKYEINDKKIEQQKIEEQQKMP